MAQVLQFPSEIKKPLSAHADFSLISIKLCTHESLKGFYKCRASAPGVKTIVAVEASAQDAVDFAIRAVQAQIDEQKGLANG